MAAAVRRGAAPAAAAVAAELLHEGHQELLGDLAAHLAGSGGWVFGGGMAGAMAAWQCV